MKRAIPFLILVLGATAGAGEKQPEGPPWVTDFPAAIRQGLERGVPVFVYLTKTH